MQIKLKASVLALVAFFAYGTQAKACDLCAVYMAQQAKGEDHKGFFAGFAEQFTHFGTLQNDGHEIANPYDQHMESSVTQVFVGYNFLDFIGVQVNLPIIDRAFQRTQETYVQKGMVSGIGDLSTHLNLNFLYQFAPGVTFSGRGHAGVKFPTGSSSYLAEELNEGEEDEEDPPPLPESGIHGHDLALGSGSYDGVFGTELYFAWQRVFLSGGVQYVVRTRGSYGYRYADDLTWNGGPGVFILMDHNYTLSLQVNASGEWKKLDDLNGEPSTDTGMTSVYLGPDLQFTWSKWVAMDLGADLPILLDNTSLQAVPDYRLRLGVTFNLPI